MINQDTGKLGPVVASGTIDTTVRIVDLQPGEYTFESTVACYVLQGDAEGVGTSGAVQADVNTLAEMTALGVPCPANTEIGPFYVDAADPSLAYVASAGGTFRINRRDKGKRA